MMEAADAGHSHDLGRTVQMLDFSESRMGYRHGFPLIWGAVLPLPPGAMMAPCASQLILFGYS